MPPVVECSLPLQVAPSGGLFFYGGAPTFKGTDEETKAHRVMQGAHIRPNWDFSMNFPPLLYTSQSPCEESRAGITGLKLICRKTEARAEKGLHRRRDRKGTGM